jgi:alpha-1,3-rhamnosyl/mannosyltransferase
MHVAIDVSAAVGRERSGVGTYTAHLVAGLRMLAESRNDLTLTYLTNRFAVAAEENASTLPAAAIYANDRYPTRLLWMQAGVPRSIRRIRPDVCHFPNHLGPVLRAPSVPCLVTMHDMSVFRCPEYHTRKTVLVHRAIMPALVRGNCWILTVSESARRDAIEWLKVPVERTRVVYSGVAPAFNPNSTLADLTTLARHGLRAPYVLAVGTLEPRKNHARLVTAFLRLVRQERLPHQLVIAGAGGWKGRVRSADSLSAALEKDGTGRVRLLGYVPSVDLPALYRRAHAFAFPSLYEGFGLPVLESLASGTPTLISRDPALTEVAGTGAVVRVDAHSVDDIAAGLLTVLSDTTVRAAARARGLERARAFSWESCARQTYQVYRDVAGVPRTGHLFAAS